MYKLLLYLLSTLAAAFTGGCQPGKQELLKSSPLSLVSIPRLSWVKPPTQAVASVPLVDSIAQVWPSFIGLFPFAPRLLVEKADSLGERDFLSGRGYRALETADSLSTDGLELLMDYPHNLLDLPLSDSLAHQTFPVYVVNATSRTKLLYGFSSRVYAIQEAWD